MLIRHYDFHGVVGMRIARPHALPFGGMIDRVYRSYEVKGLDRLDLDIIFGECDPDLKGAIRVGAYDVKADSVFARFSYKGAKWRVEIRLEEENRITVRADLNFLGAVGFSSTTLVNLVKLAFAMRGFASVHGACFGRNGRVVLLPARSGVGKTLLSLHMLKKGFHLLGDDKVFVRGSQAFGHLLPINLKSSYSELPDIRISPMERLSIRAKKTLSRLTGGYLQLLTPTSLDRVFPGKLMHQGRIQGILHLVSGPEWRVSEGNPPEAFVRQMLVNSQVEATEFTRMADAHAHVFPRGFLAGHWEAQAEIFGESFRDLPRKVCVVPQVFTPAVAEKLEALISEWVA
jgi:hypothetical protein